MAGGATWQTAGLAGVLWGAVLENDHRPARCLMGTYSQTLILSLYISKPPFSSRDVLYGRPLTIFTKGKTNTERVKRPEILFGWQSMLKSRLWRAKEMEFETSHFSFFKDCQVH